MNDSIKIPVHYPQDFKHAHIRSQAEELLNQIEALDAAISTLLIRARYMQESLKK
jgi:hypothetical protein